MALARFRVLWGDPRHGLVQEIVEAHDREGALVEAAERRPELPRPRVAFLVSPPTPDLHCGDEHTL